MGTFGQSVLSESSRQNFSVAIHVAGQFLPKCRFPNFWSETQSAECQCNIFATCGPQQLCSCICNDAVLWQNFQFISCQKLKPTTPPKNLTEFHDKISMFWQFLGCGFHLRKKALVRFNAINPMTCRSFQSKNWSSRELTSYCLQHN